MLKLFSVSDNTFHTRGFPWIARIEVGLEHGGICPECDGPLTQPKGDLQVTLEPKKGRKWPDVIGCGSYPLFIVSTRVLDAWRADRIGDLSVGGRVVLSTPVPTKLQNVELPTYYWLDGRKMFGANLDFEASGFVGVQFCSICGRRWDDIEATSVRQRSSKFYGYALKQETWQGANLFTTDLSPTAFFCTSAAVETAHKYGLTNFRFVPAEEGIAAESKGLNYLTPIPPNE